MKKILLLIGLVVTASLAVAQNNGGQSCGTGPVPAAVKEFLKDIDYTAPATEDIINVPVTIHIVRPTGGGGSFSAARVLDGICNVNSRFASASMNFFIAGDIHFIDDSDLLNITNYQMTTNMIIQHNVPRTVNIYYTNLSAMSLCGFAYYPNSGPGGSNNQGAVVMSFACSTPTGTTLAHELGHFFALPHTFDQTSDDPLDPFDAELVTRSTSEVLPRRNANCNTAGDYFCDTPSDFIGYRWACPTAAFQTDLNGDRLRPDSSFYMSYANDICTNRFSEQQITAMRATLAHANASRGYLLTPPMPNYAAITTTPVLISPANGDSNIAGNFAYFSWSSVPGATFYNFKIYQFGGILMDTLIQDTTHLNLTTNIRANRTLEWEVRAMNPSSLCAPVSSRFTFKTGNYLASSSKQLLDEKLKIYPTVLKPGETIKLEGLEDGPLVVEFRDLSGKVIQRYETLVAEHYAELSVGYWPAGIYLALIRQDQQLSHRKILLQP